LRSRVTVSASIRRMRAFCDDLLPQKARILLMLALTVTRERKAIQEMFYTY